MLQAQLIQLLESITYLSVTALGTHLDLGMKTFYSATNRALANAGDTEYRVRSAVLCGRECSMDGTCRSFNFYRDTGLCRLSNATRSSHPMNFCQSQGSVYFDTERDTPALSVADDPLIGTRRSCKALFNAGHNSSGIYTIYPHGSCDNGIRVYCDMELDGGGWTVFQRRQDGSVDFYRNWADYQTGFGNLSGEFWLGNDNLVALTSDDSRGTWQLRVELEDWGNNTLWAGYEDFKISQELYTLSIGRYDSDSTAGDSLMYHKRMGFSTQDRDNDVWPDNCAGSFQGGWWFRACIQSHLNGVYKQDGPVTVYAGIKWVSPFDRYVSLKSCSMQIIENGQGLIPMN